MGLCQLHLSVGSSTAPAAVQSLSCPTPCDPMNWCCQTSLSFSISLSLRKLTSTESAMLSNPLFLCLPLLSSSIFPTFFFYKTSTSVGPVTVNASLTAVLPETSFSHGAHNSLLIPLSAAVPQGFILDSDL